MNAKDINKQAQKHAFIQNNGMIMRMLNILEGKERKVGSIKYIMHEVPSDELDRSLHYLQDSGYIRIQQPKGAASFDTVSDSTAYYKLEITSQGMELLMGITENPAVEI